MITLHGPRSAMLVIAMMLSWSAGIGTAADVAPATSASALPVHGFHTMAPARADLDAFVAFVTGPLAREGVDTLILQIDYGYDYHSLPEFGSPWALRREDLQRIAAACRGAGMTLIPLIDCLGHQSWAANNAALLTKHPEFDECQGKFPGNQGIYCRSWCPLHPHVHEVVFALMDELIDACGARAFHVGMDEVFLLADRDCPRCAGKDPAELFAGEATLLHDHLAARGCRMWMWGDRLIDGKATGIGEWEASINGTAPAIDRIPKDIVICDWHYEKAEPTPSAFIAKGFPVVACPWRRSEVALAQLASVRRLRQADGDAARLPLGMLMTTWSGFMPFAAAYRLVEDGAAASGEAAENARCFRALAGAWRAQPEVPRP